MGGSMTFEQQLIITIVDKAIIGALVAVAVFVLSRNLERFKSTQALSNEYTKQRLVKVADLWEVLYAWEAETVDFSRLVHRAIGFGQGEASQDLQLDRYAGRLTVLQDRAREIKLAIERTQFWLGEDLRKRFLRYHQAIFNHVGNMSGDCISSAVSKDAMGQLETQLAAVRQSIFAFMEPAPSWTTTISSWLQRKTGQAM